MLEIEVELLRHNVADGGEGGAMQPISRARAKFLE